MTTDDSEWTLEFTITTIPDPIYVNFGEELLLGRTPTTDTTENLDLTPYGGEQLGVSRQHALIRKTDATFTIRDLDSSNGTLINGERLIPQTAHSLRDGDQIGLGQLQLTIHFNQDIGDSAILAQRVLLNLRLAPRLGRGQRILIVEDEVPIARLYQLLLEKDGFVTQISRDVVSAIRALNEYTCSLVILDLMLPTIHGMELCRYIRRDTENPTLPIVILSARTEPSLIQQAIDAGADIYIGKPPNNRELSRVVSALIELNERDNPLLKTKPLGQHSPPASLSTAVYKDTVVLFIQGHREPLTIVVSPQITFGHQKVNEGPFRHIDLEGYGALDKGVSRMHAALKQHNREFFLEDLNSTNGTFINGYSLMEHQDHLLKNADEIRLGGLRMHIYMLAEND